MSPEAEAAVEMVDVELATVCVLLRKYGDRKHLWAMVDELLDKRLAASQG